MMKRLFLALLTGLVLVAPAARAADGMDPALREKARRAVDAGLHYLRGQQAADGSVARSVGITALSLRAFLESHRGYSESDGAFVTRQVEYLLSKVNKDGSISESLQNTSYNTAVAVNALVATKNPKYDAVVAGARKFLIAHQIDEREGYTKDHRYYGGIGDRKSVV
jgi:squalene-hopene/tetraprenyl-beta-curcumene cyclase